MRNINPSEIINKKYSIINNQTCHSIDFYSEEIVNYILKNNISVNSSSFQQFKEKDELLLEKEALRYCKTKNIDILKNKKDFKNLLEEPYKKFEIFKLNINGGKICIASTDELPETKGDKELYYDLEIAIQVFENKTDLQDLLEIEDDIYDLYRNEIIEKEEKIKELIFIDETKYIDELNSHKLLKNTPLYNDYKVRILENEKIKRQLEEYNQKVINLSKMLKIALDKLESDKLLNERNKKQNIFKKFMNILKN